MTPSGIETVTIRLVAHWVHAYVLSKYSTTKFGVLRKVFTRRTLPYVRILTLDSNLLLTLT